VTHAPASALANTVTERTEAGEQLLAPFVAPVSARQRIDRLMAQPLQPRKPQKPLDIGLGSGPRSGTGVTRPHVTS
jgi:hypothetical protein